MTKQDVLNHCISGLNAFELAGLNTRIYDNSFDVLSAPITQKRLVMVGLNGSEADAEFESVQSLEQSFAEDHSFCNVSHGAENGWNGFTGLANRLIQLPRDLGFSIADTIYTNAILMCSKNASVIKEQARFTHLGNYEALKAASMRYFGTVTLALAEAELILAYSNGHSGISAARILYDAFGDNGPIDHVSKHPYWATYSFVATIEGRKYPVVGIRHLSRFKPDPNLVMEAWTLAKVRIVSC